MKIGITYDAREDYGVDTDSSLFADFCHPGELEYMEQAIRNNGYEAERIGNMYQLNQQILSGTFDCDLILVADEGILSRNREAIVPALLELNKIPYIGSDAYAMGLSQNKEHTKLVVRELGIPVPKGFIVEEEPDDMETYIATHMEETGLHFPFIVKPIAEGYSMGVFLVHDLKEAGDKIYFNLTNYKDTVICEEFIEGAELYVPIVGDGEQAYTLGVGELTYEDGTPVNGIFTVEEKSFKDLPYRIPDLDERIKKQLMDWSLRIHNHFRAKDFGRIDYKMSPKGVPYFIEYNPRPGLVKEGPFETGALSIGKSYDEIMGEIIMSARKRYQI